MIELLLQAERALSMGMIDQAEGIYRQAAAADPRNSIAVVGLARVALERADDAEAWRQATRALAIDPENAAARRLVDRLEEVFRHRGQAVPSLAEVPPSAPADGAAGPQQDPSTLVEPVVALVEAAAAPASETAANSPATSAPPAPAQRRGIIDRLLGRKTP